MEELEPGSVHPTLPPPSRLPRGRRVIAVGGGRGGVGKSTLTLNLGVYFAQLGRSVVVCDADPAGSNLHAMLGLAQAPVVPYDPEADQLAKPVATPVPGLSLFPSAFDVLAMAPVKPARRSEWQKKFASVEADYVLIHLGASTSTPSLDLFASADVSVCVTAPEPVAIETTYGFLRALFSRGLKRRLMREKLKVRLVERAVEQLAPMSSPLDIVEAIHRYDTGLGGIAAYELSRLAPRLVVGQSRLRSDLELGPAMAAISERFLGIHIDYLGHIEHDDAAWLSIRRRNPLLIESPTSKSARNIERIARRVLALLMAQDARVPVAASPPAWSPSSGPPSGSINSGVSTNESREWRRPLPKNLYEVLGVTRTAADDEIRRAYKRQREIFRDGSFPVVSVVREAALRDEQARIEEAYDTLLDPNKRRAYDLSTFPLDIREDAQQERRIDDARAAELMMLQAELAREIHAETEFSGALLKKVREAQGVELIDIAQRTKISTLHLGAIEDERAQDLPAMVYVQGFVQEVAKFLKLDTTQVTRTYMRRIRDIAARQRSG
ncbi:MAG: P-loop NTPase [Polyangiaceae bacterium]|nr:P-loop NTPase [Polyangiaceae bacterium]